MLPVSYSYQLFIGCSSILKECGKILFLALRTDLNGLRVALDGQLIATSLEILVALVLG